MKYCKYHRNRNCKFGERCYIIHETSIIIPCPYGVNCVHKNCWYSHGHFLSTTKIEKIFKEVKDLKTRLTSIENRTAYECHCHDTAPADDQHKYTNRKQDFEKDVQTKYSPLEPENIKAMIFRKEDETEIAAENIPVITSPNQSSFEVETQKNTNTLQVSPKVSKKKNFNPNQIAVGDTVSFAGWVGLEADVYITFTGEVLKIDQERGGSLVKKNDGTGDTSWLTTRKLKKQTCIK